MGGLRRMKNKIYIVLGIILGVAIIASLVFTNLRGKRKYDDVNITFSDSDTEVTNIYKPQFTEAEHSYGDNSSENTTEATTTTEDTESNSENEYAEYENVIKSDNFRSEVRKILEFNYTNPIEYEKMVVTSEFYDKLVSGEWSFSGNSSNITWHKSGISSDNTEILCEFTDGSSQRYFVIGTLINGQVSSLSVQKY